jgi:hypothetical protein
VAVSSWLCGNFLETAGPVANVVILAALGAAMGDVMVAGARHTLPLRFATASATIAAFWLFFPNFERNVLYSSYADTASIAAVGILALLGLSLLERLTAGYNADNRAFAWRFGLVATALVLLKQANPVLLALLTLGLLVAGWRSGRLRRTFTIRLSLPMLLPAVVVFLLWRQYVATNLVSSEMSFRAFALWNWDKVFALLHSLGYEWTHNPPFHLLMWGVTLVGIWKLRLPRRPEEMLAVITAVVWIGYNLFLMVVYLGAMTPEEAGNAADYWRYTPHAGMLAVATVLVYLRSLSWPTVLVRWPQSSLWLCTILLPLAILIAEPQQMSASAKEWPAHFRAVGHDLADILPSNARLVVLGGGYLKPTWDAIDYDLHRYGRDDHNLRRWWEPEITLQTFQSGKGTHLLVMDR